MTTILEVALPLTATWEDALEIVFIQSEITKVQNHRKSFLRTG